MILFNSCLFVLLVGSFEARRLKNDQFIEPKRYCGPKLTKHLHDFCQFFYGPSDVDDNIEEHQTVAEECCESPCTLLYLILAYCKTPKKDMIKTIFGDAEVKLYESKENGRLSDVYNRTIILPTESVRIKKHARRRRRRRRGGKKRKSHRVEYRDYPDTIPIIFK